MYASYIIINASEPAYVGTSIILITSISRFWRILIEIPIVLIQRILLDPAAKNLDLPRPHPLRARGAALALRWRWHGAGAGAGAGAGMAWRLHGAARRGA
jgi:hypothetical protein